MRFPAGLGVRVRQFQPVRRLRTRPRGVRGDEGSGWFAGALPRTPRLNRRRGLIVCRKVAGPDPAPQTPAGLEVAGLNSRCLASGASSAGAVFRSVSICCVKPNQYVARKPTAYPASRPPA